MVFKKILLSAIFVGLFAVEGLADSSVRADDVDGLDLVVLVDESASLKQSGVQKEISAVTALVSRRELSSDAPVRVSIIGFGSGKSATSVKCRLTEVTTSVITDLVSCAGKVRLRTKRGSRDTDFAAAFRAANLEFESALKMSNKRAVILMTDGIYDPSGRREADGLGAGEVAALNSSLAEMSRAGIQVWPLGFGKVNEQELGNLAVAGAAADCPAGTAKPYATVASGASLGDYLLEILEATLCRQIEPPKTIPASFEVHPLVSGVSIAVRGALLDPSVIDGTGSEVCDGKWLKATDGSIACQIDINGEQVGSWTIAASGDTVGKVAPTVETSVEGRVAIALVGCVNGTPSVELKRQDGTEIKWDSADKTEWPQLSVSSGSTSQLLTANQSSVAIVADSFEDGQRIDVSLAPDQPDFIWLRGGADVCDYMSTATTTESTVEGSPPSTTVPTSTSSDENPVLPFILVALLILVVVALLMIVRSRRRKFPLGTELKQYKQQGATASWSLRADLGGLQEVGLVVDANGWLNDTGSTNGAQYIVKKSRKRDMGEVLVISIDETAGRREHYFTYDTECSLDGLRFKIEMPQEVDDDFVE